MRLVLFEEEIFLNLMDVLYLVVGISDESRQRVKGTTTYGAIRQDSKRWTRNCLKRRVCLFNAITVIHCAQFTRMHCIDNS